MLSLLILIIVSSKSNSLIEQSKCSASNSLKICWFLATRGIRLGRQTILDLSINALLSSADFELRTIASWLRQIDETFIWIVSVSKRLKRGFKFDQNLELCNKNETERQVKQNLVTDNTVNNSFSFLFSFFMHQLHRIILPALYVSYRLTIPVINWALNQSSQPTSMLWS